MTSGESGESAASAKAGAVVEQSPLPMATVERVTLVELACGARLELPDEPGKLREGLRDALLAGQDPRDGFSDDICIGVWLWREWQPALEPLGLSREDFITLVSAYHRELWLWLIGDRQWAQFVSGLAGRIARRLPSPTTTA